MNEKLKTKYFFNDLDDKLLLELFSPELYVWQPLKKLKQLIDLNIKMSKIDPTVELGRNVVIKGNCVIGKGTVIHPNAVIYGPVVIGENVEIGPGAYIRPYSLIGDSCMIGHGAEIKHSILLKRSKVQTNTFVGDSIIGEAARVGSGAITANRRFDQKDIGIKVEGQYYNFETDYFGCILGDYSRLGANATTLPGTLIGPHNWIMPSMRLNGFSEEGKLINEELQIKIKDNEKHYLKD